MNLSRAYSLAYGEELSVGRVQTPTLAMVVERELAIRGFVPEDYLEVVATFRPAGDERVQPARYGDQIRGLMGKEVRIIGQNRATLAAIQWASVGSFRLLVGLLPLPLCHTDACSRRGRHPASSALHLPNPACRTVSVLSALGREYLSNAAVSGQKSNQSILNIASSLIVGRKGCYQ
jgi:hypothetical protein